MGFTAFLDFEFSQGPTFPKEEIISFGCVIYDDSLKEIDSFYSLCKPKVNRTISPRISRITKIYQKDIMKAPHFVSMMNEFIKIVKKYPDIQFYSWGSDDWKVFKDELKVNRCFWIKKFIPQIIDLQIEVFNSIQNYGKKLWTSPKNLITMAKFYNTPLLDAHNALNDARMLAYIYKAKKTRGRYFYSDRKFEFTDKVSKADIDCANSIAVELKSKEKRNTIKRMMNSYGNQPLMRILDGNLYHLVEPVLAKPLFTRKKKRNYTDFMTEIQLDIDNECLMLHISSTDMQIDLPLDIEEQYGLINSLLHMYSGNRRRQKNWRKRK